MRLVAAMEKSDELANKVESDLYHYVEKMKKFEQQYDELFLQT